ncbi:hypothetical protein, partial [Pseudoxanthobacter sp.]|uniref:hypothetical protein n=1 Tax=Pseudoxanthobacter sp. TaxID=1925742 RepID=UPI002FE1B441
MTPGAFRSLVVGPDILDFAANPADLRHAMNAIHSVDALAAHIHDASDGANRLPRRSRLSGEARSGRCGIRAAARRGESDPARRSFSWNPTDLHPEALRSRTEITSQPTGFGQAIWGEFEWDAPLRVVVGMNGGPFRH